jgi:hypothetical protein
MTRVGTRGPENGLRGPWRGITTGRVMSARKRYGQATVGR